MNKQAQQLALMLVFGHLGETHEPDLEAFGKKYGIPDEEITNLVMPIVYHVWQHGYEAGTHDDPYTEEQLAEMRAEAEKQENPLNDIATKLDADGNTLIDDSLCQLLGTC